MFEKKIILKTLESVKSFVALTNSKPYDIELLSGKYVVNAKSIMGVFSLDLTRPLTMVINADSDADLEQELIPYLYIEEPAMA